MRIIMGLAFAGILVSLGSALFYLMRDRESSRRTVKALTVRIGLSVALFIFVLLAHALGWIDASGLH